MNSQKTSALSQLGYLTSQRSIPVGFSGSPSAAAIAEQGIHVALDPIASFPVTEASIRTQPLAVGPLAALTQTMSPPVFISQARENVSPEIRTDEIMEQLLRKGYIVEHRVYEGTYPSYMIARTRLGDRVFVRIDDQQYRMSFPQQLTTTSDIQMEKRSSVVLVPQETKMGVLQCLDYNICAAAFVCDNSICITQRRGTENSSNFTEENFVFKSGGTSFTGGKIGSSIVAYPIILLSEILKDPVKTEERISMASNEIAKVSFARLRSYDEDLRDAVKRLTTQSENLAKFATEADKELSRDIKKLSDAYDKIKDIAPDTLSDRDQADYYAIQRALVNKKELRTQILNSIASAYKTSGMTRSISEEFRNNIDPVLTAYKNSIGNV